MSGYARLVAQDETKFLGRLLGQSVQYSLRDIKASDAPETACIINQKWLERLVDQSH